MAEANTAETIRQRYRTLLKRPALSDREIDDMRKHVARLTRTICEHLWGKPIY